MCSRGTPWSDSTLAVVWRNSCGNGVVVDRRHRRDTGPVVTDVGEVPGCARSRSGRRIPIVQRPHRAASLSAATSRRGRVARRPLGWQGDRAIGGRGLSCLNERALPRSSRTARRIVSSGVEIDGIRYSPSASPGRSPVVAASVPTRFPSRSCARTFRKAARLGQG